MKFALTVCAAAALALCSCAVRPQPVNMAFTPELSRRADAFAAILRHAPVRGTLLASAYIADCSKNPDLFMNQLKRLGFNRLYLEVKNMTVLDEEKDDFRLICEKAAVYGIKCELTVRQSSFVISNYKNVWKRRSQDRDPLITLVRQIEDFNDSLNDYAKLSGVMIMVEVHRFLIGSPELPANSLYAWSEDSYGSGRDNNMLMAVTLRQLRTLKSELRNLPLNCGVITSYQEKVNSNDLSTGAVSEFLQVADYVLLLGEGEKISEYAKSFNASLQAAAKAKSGPRPRLLCGLTIASHTSGTQKTIRRRDWQDLLKVTDFIVRKVNIQSSFGGVVFIPWHDIELLWQK